MGKNVAVLFALTFLLFSVCSVSSFPNERDLDHFSRIVGGTNAEVGEFPFVGRVQSQISSEYSAFCGTFLVSSHFLITAAHCCVTEDAGFQPVARAGVTVSIGGYTVTGMNSGTPGPSNGGEFRTIKKVTVHPQYTSDYDYDICILELTTASSVTERVQLNFDGEIPGTTVSQATVAGWGTTSYGGSASNVLLKVNVPIVDNSQCNFLYEGMITSRMLCAGDTTNGNKDACQGDSGGALFYYDSAGNATAIGVVSFGNGCGQASYPGVYARISSFETWICDETNNEPVACGGSGGTPSGDGGKSSSGRVLPFWL